MAFEAVPTEKQELKIGAVVVGVLSLTPPGFERADVNCTTREGLVVKTRPSQLVDYGEASARIEFDPDVHDDLLAMATDLTDKSCEMSFLKGTSVEAKAAFSGYIKSIKPAEAGEEGNLEADIVLRVNSAVVWSNPGVPTP
jgi:hypothetical protein